MLRKCGVVNSQCYNNDNIPDKNQKLVPKVNKHSPLRIPKIATGYRRA